ncbi:MAG: hypothetical protein ACT4P6_00935 [Gemmatimonadaceae bacterium]
MTDPIVRHSVVSPALQPWIRSAALGTVLGTLFLGIGGRAAMRAIASVQNAASGYSFGGTMTVVFLGAASGLAAGVIYAACRRLFTRHVWWARALFAVILLAITLRGLRPLDEQRLIIFLPLFIAFGFAFDRLWDSAVRPWTVDT